MLLSGPVVPHLKRFLSEVSDLEELPHSFDDTLVDKLLEAIDFSDTSVIDFLKTELNGDVWEASSVSLSVLLQLTEKVCAAGLADKLMAELEHLLSEIHVILYQGRPAKVLSDALRLCLTCLSLYTDWSNVLQWAFIQLPLESVTIFVRTQIENIFIELDVPEVHSKLHLLVRMFTETNSPINANGIARVLLKHQEHLSADSVRALLSHIEGSRRVGQTVYDLAAAILSPSREPSFCQELFDFGKWSSEEVRKETAMSAIRRGLPVEMLSEAVEFVLLSPCVKLHNFIDLIPLLDTESFNEYLQKLLPSLGNRVKSPMTDVTSLFRVVLPRLQLAEAAPILEAVGCRLLESADLQGTVESAYDSDCFDQECLSQLKLILSNRLSEAIASPNWEDRDGALEMTTSFPTFFPLMGDVARLSKEDSSPYVRASALRCLIRQNSPDLYQICEEMLRVDIDNEPCVEAMSFLEKQLPSSLNSVFRLLHRLIEHSDPDVKDTMLRMCPSLLENAEFAMETRSVLEEWLDDPEIGSRVRSLLGLSVSPPSDPALRVLDDMFSALSIQVDDTIDCY